MRIALIGDVHANMAALDTVMADIDRRGTDIVINTGDYTGYGPFPDETVKYLMKTESVGVIGNYDKKVLKAGRKQEEWKGRKREEKRKSFLWALKHLGPESLEYLSSLPERKRFRICGKTVLLTHGSPERMDEHLGPDTPKKRLEELTYSADADIVIVGHSHKPFARKVKGIWFINPGSVGRPDDGDPRASYAILNIKAGYFRIDHYRVKYDVERTVEAIGEKGLPEAFAKMFAEGVNLDEAVLLHEPWTEMLSGDPHDRDDPPLCNGKSSLEKAETLMDEKAPTHASHCRQTAWIALALFDQLMPIHSLDDDDRLALELGANLHDIGWPEGQANHHKTAFKIIRKVKGIIPDDRIRLMAALIARYHRGPDPDTKHSRFGKLSADDRKAVEFMSSLMRIADGLDWDHVGNVKSIACETDEEKVTLRCSAQDPTEAEKIRVLEKGNLFEKITGRKLYILWD